MAPVVYTGSIGMFAAADVDPATGRLRKTRSRIPGNHYGVYKLANEGTARIYWADNGVPSVGLRPMTVYGAGRDQGMTSSPTVAIAAAVLGIAVPDHVRRRTRCSSTPRMSRRRCSSRSRSAPDGARIFNLGGSPVSIEDWIEAIEAAVPGARRLLTFEPAPLPFPPDIQHDRLAALGDVPVTAFRDAIAATAESTSGSRPTGGSSGGAGIAPAATAGAATRTSPLLRAGTSGSAVRQTRLTIIGLASLVPVYADPVRPRRPGRAPPGLDGEARRFTGAPPDIDGRRGRGPRSVGPAGVAYHGTARLQDYLALIEAGVMDLQPGRSSTRAGRRSSATCRRSAASSCGWARPASRPTLGRDGTLVDDFVRGGSTRNLDVRNARCGSRSWHDEREALAASALPVASRRAFHGITQRGRQPTTELDLGPTRRH